MLCTLRNIRYGLLAFAVSTCLIGQAPQSVQADPIMRTVVLEASLAPGEDPIGVLTVEFTGTDLNGNNLIDVVDPGTELTALSAHWVPIGDAQPEFTGDLANSGDDLAFRYDTQAESLLQLLINDETLTGAIIDCQESCAVGFNLIIKSPIKENFSEYVITSQEVGSPTPIPEPSTWLMLGTGLLGLLGYAYARRQRLVPAPVHHTRA